MADFYEGSSKDTTVVSKDGKTTSLPSSLADDLINSQQAREATSEELKKAIERSDELEEKLRLVHEKEGSLTDYATHNIGGIAANAVSGFGFGLPAIAAKELGYGQYLKDFDATSPGLAAASRFGGTIAGLAVGAGEVGAGLRGGMAARRIMQLGAEGADIGRGARALVGAAKWGAEGAALGLEEALNENALGDAKLNAEKVVATVGHSALFAAGLGAAGGLLSRGAKLSRLEASLEESASKGKGTVESAVAGAESGSAETPGFIAKKLDSSFNDAVLRAIGFDSPGAQRLEETINKGAPGRFERTFMNLVEERDGPSLFKSSPKEINKWVKRELPGVGEEIGAMVRRADDIKAVAPRYSDLEERIFTEVIQPSMTEEALAERASRRIDREWKVANGIPDTAAERAYEKDVKFSPPLHHEIKPLHENEVADVVDIMGRLKKIGDDGTNAQVHDILHRLDDKIDYFVTNPNGLAEKNLRAMRRIVSDELNHSIESSFEATNQNMAGDWRRTNHMYGVLKEAERASGSKSMRLMDGASPVDVARSAAGAGVGVMGALSGHPVAAGGAYFVNKAINSAGLVKARMLRATAALLGMSRVITQADHALESGVRKLTSGTVPKKTIKSVLDIRPRGKMPMTELYTATGTAIERRRRYAVVSEAIRTASAASVAESVAANLGDLADHAPETAAAVAETAARGVHYLQQNLPPNISNPYSLTPQLSDPNRMTSDIEISVFMQKAEAVNNPIGVLTMISDGKGTRHHVKAIKAVYPKMYDQMTAHAHQILTYANKPMSFQQNSNMGVLLDRPTMRSMTDSYQKALAPTFVSSGGPQKPVPSGANMHMAQRSMTSLDRVTRK